MPRLPARTAASSDRMSPNRFSVTMTSKSAGRRTSSIAHESTSWWASVTSGMLGARPRRRPSATGARSPGRWPCRRTSRDRGASAASSNASRTMRRISGSEYGSVSSAVAVARLAGRLAAVAEVDAAGQLADDEHVHAVEQLRAQRRGRGQRRMDADRSQVGEQAQAAAQREQRLLRADRRGRIGPLRVRRPRRAGSRRPRRRRSTSSGRMATPYASIAAPPTRNSDHSTANPNALAGRVDDAPGGGHDLRPDAVARDRRDPIGEVALRHGSPCSVRGATNATATPLISAPWSLLTAIR